MPALEQSLALRGEKRTTIISMMGPFLLHALTFQLHQYEAVAELQEMLARHHWQHATGPQQDLISQLAHWLQRYEEVLAGWPGNAMLALVRELVAAAHGAGADAERVFHLASDLAASQLNEVATLSVLLNVAVDAYDLHDVCSSRFFLTGYFVQGDLDACAAMTRSAGGDVAETMDADVNYLVLGGLGLPDWYLGERGVAYELAAVYRRLGMRVRIVHEAQWFAAVQAMRGPEACKPRQRW